MATLDLTLDQILGRLEKPCRDAVNAAVASLATKRTPPLREMHPDPSNAKADLREIRRLHADQVRFLRMAEDAMNDWERADIRADFEGVKLLAHNQLGAGKAVLEADVERYDAAKAEIEMINDRLENLIAFGESVTSAGDEILEKYGR